MNLWLQDNNIEMYSPHNEEKSDNEEKVLEHFIGGTFYCLKVWLLERVAKDKRNGT